MLLPGRQKRTERKRSNRAASKINCVRNSYAPSLELLETRIVPSTWSGDIYDGLGGSNGPLFTNDQVQEIVGNVHVPAGKTLTIQAGAVVKFDISFNMTVDGTLLAQGTSGQTITITSINDNSPEGGSNNASAGNWGAIQFNSDSTGNELVDTKVVYGGGWGNVAAVVDNSATLTMNNSTVGNSNSAAMRITNAAPTLAGDTFQNNFGPAISMDLVSDPVITGVTLTNNPTNGVLLDTGSLSGDASWNNPDIVYCTSGNVTVPQGDTLTVAPGQIVKAPFGNNNLIINGTLNAQGTQANPIVFTSFRDDARGGDTNNDGAGSASNGDWGSIQFASTSTNNQLNFASVLFSGGWGNIAAVVDTSAPLTLSNGLIGNSFTAGIRIAESNPTLANDTFQNSFTAAISMDLTSDPLITGVTLTNNPINGVLLDTGSLSGDASWNNPDIVYCMSGNVTVPQGDTLTVAPGQVVKALRQQQPHRQRHAQCARNPGESHRLHLRAR